MTLTTPDQPNNPNPISRLMPVLFRVVKACRTDQILSQWPLLMDWLHCSERHPTLLKVNLGVPRKGVQMFARKCIICNGVDVKKKNARIPRQNACGQVLERYTLDLIDRHGEVAGRVNRCRAFTKVCGAHDRLCQ